MPDDVDWKKLRSTRPCVSSIFDGVDKQLSAFLSSQPSRPSRFAPVVRVRIVHGASLCLCPGAQMLPPECDGMVRIDDPAKTAKVDIATLVRDHWILGAMNHEDR